MVSLPSEVAHYGEPTRLGVTSDLVEYVAELLHLRSGQLYFQLFAGWSENQLPHPPVMHRSPDRDEIHFNQLAEWCIERLLADIKRREQVIDRNVWIAAYKIEYAVVNTAQATPFKDSIGQGSK